MNVKGFSYRMALSLLLVAGMAASCTMYYVEEPITNQRGAKEGADGLSLALSVTSNNMPRTKMQDDVTQSANTGSGDPTFRGLQDVHILPFRHAGSGGKESPVQGSDPVNSGEIELPYTGISNTFTNANWTEAEGNRGLVNNNFAHLYELVSVPRGTASVTVYAKATEDAEPTDADDLRTHRKTYGALTDKFSTAIESAGDVTFQPVPIMKSTGTELNTLVGIMNRFIGISGSNTYYYVTGSSWWGGTSWSDQQTITVSWNGASGNDTLDNYFNAFTNNGEIISGAGNSIEHLLSDHQIPPVWGVDGETVTSPAVAGESKKIGRVFIQDFVTNATFRINETSLQKAYYSVPDLRASQMSLGLSVDLQWIPGINYVLDL